MSCSFLKDSLGIASQVWHNFVSYNPKGNFFQSPQLYNFYKSINEYEPIVTISTSSLGNINGSLLAVLQKEKDYPKGRLSSRCIIYGGHHHKNIFTKFSISYWLYEKFCIDKRIISLSAQVLSGSIDRNTAIEELKKKPYDETNIERNIEYIIKKLDLSKPEFGKYFTSLNHAYVDYPSYYPMMLRFTKYLAPIMGKILPNKPMVLFQMEMRDK